MAKYFGVYLRSGGSLLAATAKSANKKRYFDPRKFLATIGAGRKVVSYPKKQTIFTQGDAADTVFYIQTGKVRLAVVSENGKEATLGILGEREFFGEGGPSGTAPPHGVCNRNDGLRTSAD